MKDDKGHYLTEQVKILKYKKYHQNLFANNKETLEKVNLEEVLKKSKIKKGSDQELGHTICPSEISEVLKNIKHNKSPVMDIRAIN